MSEPVVIPRPRSSGLRWIALAVVALWLPACAFLQKHEVTIAEAAVCVLENEPVIGVEAAAIKCGVSLFDAKEIVAANDRAAIAKAAAVLSDAKPCGSAP